jgi:hypothetical protein
MCKYFSCRDVVPNPTLFLQRLICRECAKHVFLFFKFSGRCPETHSLFVGVPENIQGTIQKILFVTFLKKGNAKNFYM